MNVHVPSQLSLDLVPVTEAEVRADERSVRPLIASAADHVAAVHLPQRNDRLADLGAIETWIEARCDDAGRDQAGRPAHTARIYRRESRRFLLWLNAERGVGLAGAAILDCTAYKAFLSNPQPAAKWCAPRGTPLGSRLWRPFEGPLSASSRRQTMVILGGLYRFLQDQQYLLGNPWSGVARPRNSEPRLDSSRSLNAAQMATIEEVLAARGESAAARQLSFAVRLLAGTGLRLAEVTAARCGDLRWVDLDSPSANDGNAEDSCRGAWVLTVLGKGMKRRDVPVPNALVEALGEMLSLAGGSKDPARSPDRPLLLVREDLGGPRCLTPPRGLSDQALYRQLKRLFHEASMRLEEAGRRQDAEHLRRGSTHWLRHTYCTRAVAAGVDLDVVQMNAGHASLATTSIYVSADLGRRIRQGLRLVKSSLR